MIDFVKGISAQTFNETYVKGGRPVVIKEAMSHWDAVSRWNQEYFKQYSDRQVTTKIGNVSEGKYRTTSLGTYCDLLKKHELDLLEGVTSGNQPPYLHDYPIFYLIPDLIGDVSPFPVHYLPAWYRENWWKFVQFFMGATNSLTPLHFDTLYTHNLFFQVVGRKKFFLISPTDQKDCYLYKWRWSHVNADNPDFVKFPRFSRVGVTEVIVQAGDILYMPPGTLHQVQGMSFSVSFNIDWHTPKSVTQGMSSFLRGAPGKNLYYNSLIFLGLFLNIPVKRILPFYKSYLNYIS